MNALQTNKLCESVAHRIEKSLGLHKLKIELPADLRTFAIPEQPRWSKRLRKWLYANGIEYSEDAIEFVANIAASHCDSREYVYRLRSEIDWSPGRYNDHGSCFWGEETASRIAIDEDGDSFGLCIYERNGENFHPVGRCWLFDIGAGGTVIINAYGPLHLEQIANALAQDDESLHVNKIDVFSEIYVNGNVGMLIAQDALDTDSVDIDLPVYPVEICADCGDATHEDQMCLINERVVCEDCADHYCRCDICDDYADSTEILTTAVDGETMDVCEYCRDQRLHSCEVCDSYSRYAIETARYSAFTFAGICEECLSDKATVATEIIRDSLMLNQMVISAANEISNGLYRLFEHTATDTAELGDIVAKAGENIRWQLRHVRSRLQGDIHNDYLVDIMPIFTPYMEDTKANQTVDIMLALADVRAGLIDIVARSLVETDLYDYVASLRGQMAANDSKIRFFADLADAVKRYAPSIVRSEALDIATTILEQSDRTGHAYSRLIGLQVLASNFYPQVTESDQYALDQYSQEKLDNTLYGMPTGAPEKHLGVYTQRGAHSAITHLIYEYLCAKYGTLGATEDTTQLELA